MRQSWGLNLRDWKWDLAYNEDGSMQSLIATDTKGKVRFSWEKGVASKPVTGRHTASFPAPSATRVTEPAAGGNSDEKAASPAQVKYLQKLIGGLTPSPDKEAMAKEVTSGISARRASQLIEELK